MSRRDDETLVRRPLSDVPGSAGVLAGQRQDADEDVGAPSRDWYSQGYLPHLDSPKLFQSITYRLADSLPQEKLQLLERYHLYAWCVMPNHVHVLIEPLTDLASIVQGWKSFTSRWVLRNSSVLGLQIPQSGKLWMREYWDRYIRDESHYRKAVEYIHQNPVAAGLCATPKAWPWSSAGNAGVPAGIGSRADEDVGAPRNELAQAATVEESSAVGSDRPAAKAKALAAKLARKIAIQTDPNLVIMKDEKIIRIPAEALREATEKGDTTSA